jgi:TolB-like protein
MTIYAFGPFRLDSSLGILYREREPTVLGQRATALLQLFLERPGEPIAKNSLIETAWPNLTVEDSNLTVQIAALRRALCASGGAGWIETMPRRGYRYVGPVVSTERPPGADRAEPLGRLDLPNKPSVAVLAFTNLSGDPEQGYFADGMVDDIITGLSRIKWLFVIARNSSFKYGNHDADARKIGQDLGVRYVLQGSVRKVSDRVRVNCQLVDCASASHVWTEQYDRLIVDLFALQDEIASSVVGALEPGLRRAEVARVKRKRPESLDAYDLVLRAQPDVDSGMPDRVSRALILLERSLALDPTYAMAHGSAAMCHHCLFLRAGLREENRKASIAHARAAIEFGQDDALALTLAGFSVGMDGHDRAAAFAALEAALALSPSSALAFILGSVLRGWSGDAERAIEWSERGLRLSPFDPWAFAAYHSLALGHFKLGQFERATTAAYKAVQSNPAHSISYMLLAATLVRTGRLADGKAAAATVTQLQPNFRSSRHFAGVNCEPDLADSLSDALRIAGLPS